MTAVREQIAAEIEERYGKGKPNDTYYAEVRLELGGVKIGASIASSIWEPIVRDLLRLVERSKIDGNGESIMDARNVITRAKEALGG